ncbi:unnamed protein product [Dicrocoelium dendriticum]|nr:unnamed protein product [Dicrocoelium dendriticum]
MASVPSQVPSAPITSPSRYPIPEPCDPSRPHQVPVTVDMSQLKEKQILDSDKPEDSPNTVSVQKKVVSVSVDRRKCNQ